jgi:hypothetical protein
MADLNFKMLYKVPSLKTLPQFPKWVIFSYQSRFFGKAGEHGDVFQAEFAQDVFAVFVYGVGLDEELSGDVFVALAFSDEFDDHQLARGEFFDLFGVLKSGCFADDVIEVLLLRQAGSNVHNQTGCQLIVAIMSIVKAYFGVYPNPFTIEVPDAIKP